MHPVLLKSSTNDDALVPISAINNHQGIQPETLFIDANTGTEVRRIQNKASAHFSMPLAFENTIVMPTTNGIEVYSIPIN